MAFASPIGEDKKPFDIGATNLEPGRGQGGVSVNQGYRFTDAPLTAERRKVVSPPQSKGRGHALGHPPSVLSTATNRTPGAAFAPGLHTFEVLLIYTVCRCLKITYPSSRASGPALCADQKCSSTSLPPGRTALCVPHRYFNATAARLFSRIQKNSWSSGARSWSSCRATIFILRNGKTAKIRM